MAPLSANPDRDFSAGYGEAKSDLSQLLAESPAGVVMDETARARTITKIVVVLVFVIALSSTVWLLAR